MPFWTVLYASLFWPLLLVACLAAFRWGGPAERWTAILFIAAGVAEVLSWSAPTVRFLHVELHVAAVDIALFIGMAILTVRHNLPWLYLATAIQALAALSHVIKAMMPGLSRMAYTILSGGGGYPEVLLLILGIVLHAREERRQRRRRG